MFQLDDKFLEDLGLGSLPEDQKRPFLEVTYKRLEKVVGIRLSEGMSEAQLDQFSDIIDHKPEVVDPWLAQYAPNYQGEEVFQRLQQASGLPAEDNNLKGEYAATKWLEINRPDYRDVVARTLEEIKQEIIANRDTILGGAPQAPAA